MTHNQTYIDACSAIGVQPVADIEQTYWHRHISTAAGILDAAEFKRHCALVAEPVTIPDEMQVLKNADGSMDIWSPSGARCEYNTVPSKKAVGAAIRKLLDADGADLKASDAWYLTASE